MVQLVYVLIVYKDADQVIRLVRRLQAPNAQFLFHIDRKADAGFTNRIVAAFGNEPGCHFIRRERVYWGSWALVQVMLNAAAYVVERGIPCDFLIHMSGQDYPIRSNEEISAFFEAHRGRQFLEYFELPCQYWVRGGLDRIEYYYLHLNGRPFMFPPIANRRKVRKVMDLAARVLPTGRRVLPGGYRPYGGSAAVILARNGVEYVTEFVETSLGRKIVRFFKHAMHPDELFFQTVLMNSPLRDTVINDELRYIDWPELGAAHPRVLTADDYPRLVGSGKLFARKFGADNPEILDMLDGVAAPLTIGQDDRGQVC